MRLTKLKPATVGEILKEEFLEPMEVTVAALAKHIGVHRNTISNLLNGRSALKPSLAIKLASAFGNSPEFWLNIQHATDVWESRMALREVNIQPIVRHEEHCAFA
ncbi:HigA protein [Vibrio astriarenae]|nr:HigA protein [Vibrio sp. C7]